MNARFSVGYIKKTLKQSQCKATTGRALRRDNICNSVHRMYAGQNASSSGGSTVSMPSCKGSQADAATSSSHAVFSTTSPRDSPAQCQRLPSPLRFPWILRQPAVNYMCFYSSNCNANGQVMSMFHVIWRVVLTLRISCECLLCLYLYVHVSSIF